MPKPRRADHIGHHRTIYEKNRKKILATQNICGICGLPVDKTLNNTDPMRATVDHIIPINKNGNPSALENLQLAHWCCNRKKSDNLFVTGNNKAPEHKNNGNLTNRDLPLTFIYGRV